MSEGGATHFSMMGGFPNLSREMPRKPPNSAGNKRAGSGWAGAAEAFGGGFTPE
jgi:hypothetical protein